MSLCSLCVNVPALCIGDWFDTHACRWSKIISSNKRLLRIMERSFRCMRERAHVAMPPEDDLPRMLLESLKKNWPYGSQLQDSKSLN